MKPKMKDRSVNEETVVIGIQQPCKYCGASIRVVWFPGLGRFRIVEPMDDPAHDRLVSHYCPNFDNRRPAPEDWGEGEQR